MSYQYFDIIPNDALHNVIRFLSSNPCSENWLTDINDDDVFLVLQSDTTLSAAAHELFTSVVFLSNEQIGSRTNSLYVREIIVYDEFLNKIGPYLTHFHFPDVHGRHSYKHFQRLRVLNVDHEPTASILGIVLNASGGSLQELYLNRKNLELQIVHDVAQHCRALRKLHLVKEKSAGSLQLMWKALAGSLTDISISGSVQDYVDIARNCKNLNKLELLNFHENWTENLDMFASSLNPCILDLHFELWDEFKPYSDKRLSDVFAKFSNNFTVYTHVVSAQYVQCVRFLRAIGSKLRVLSVHCTEQELPCDISGSLSHLEELTLFQLSRGDTNAFARSLFANPLSNLRKLLVYTAINGRTLLAEIGQSVTTLQEFECYDLFSEDSDGAEAIHIKGQDFEPFLQSNKQLRRIQIRNFHRYSANGWEIATEIADLIKRLRFCTSIEEICVTDRMMKGGYQLLRNACVPLRSRRISIVVNGVSFLPSSSDESKMTAPSIQSMRHRL